MQEKATKMTHSLHKSKLSLSPEPLVSSEEIILVEGLTSWEKSKFQLSSSKVIKAAQVFLENRKNKRVSVENLIKSRKTPATTRSIIASPVFHQSPKDPFEVQKDLWNINKQFESEIHSALDQQSSQLKSLINERTKIRSDLITFRENLKISQKEIEIHKNSLKNLEKIMKNNQKKNSTFFDFSRKNSIKQEIFQKESKCAEFELELKILVDKNMKILENLDEKCALLRREIGLLRETLVKHYKKSLKDGNDPRNDGIQWIIRALWDLGLKVSSSDLPDFCDYEISQVILKLAEKNRELEEALKSRPQTKRFQHFVSSSQEKLNEIHSRLSQASKKIRLKQSKVQLVNHKKRITWTDLLPENPLEAHYANLKSSSKPSDLLQEIESLKRSGVNHLLQVINLSKSSPKLTPSLLLSSFLGIEVARGHLFTFSKKKADLPNPLYSTSNLKP
jgi:hypothetical protein